MEKSAPDNRVVDLTFGDFLAKFDQLGKGEWITVYESRRDDSEWTVFYSALIPPERAARSLEDPSWDLHIGNGLLGFTFYFNGGKETATYSRTSDGGVEPLVILRQFHGIRDAYWEVLEEFRFYFNLCEDRRKNTFVMIDDNGDEEEVILISDQAVRIKLRLIREFLAVKKMRLALFFDFSRFSNRTLEEMGIKEFHEHKKGEDFVYSIGARPWSGMSREDQKSHGFLMGKKLISGLEDFKPKLFGRDEKRKFVDFIIGIGDDGKEVTFTCGEEKLANYFGKNKGAPQYVTPVFFKNEVLTKYYAQPSKFSVEDGYLRCGGLWSLSMDNNTTDHIMVMLGDLGHLTYNEQLHWRSFNIAPRTMSRTAWLRGFEGQFADPEKADLFLKQKFDLFQERWEKKFGWRLFLPLNKDDEHYFRTLRVPLTNEQKEFDDLVLALAKIFIDSLNEKELAKGVSIPKSDAKGLDKLEAFLVSNRLRSDKMMEFLRKLQALRSTGTAHRKGESYEKLKQFFSIDQKALREVFEDILVRCIWTLNTLENHLLK